MKKLILVMTAVLLLTGVGVGAWYYFVQDRSAESSGKKLTESEKRRQDLERRLKQAGTEEEKAAAYKELSAHYSAEDNASKAVESAENAVETSPTAESYGYLGFAANQAGNKEAAIAAYKKAAELAKAAGEEDDGRSSYSYYLMQARLIEEGKL